MPSRLEAQLGGTFDDDYRAFLATLSTTSSE
jgi:hypothetical protein